VSGPLTLKLKNLKTILKNLGFFRPVVTVLTLSVDYASSVYSVFLSFAAGPRVMSARSRRITK